MTHYVTDADARFSKFDIIRTTYKTVFDHEIFTYILIPKNLSAQPKIGRGEKHPVLLRIHGGGFATASSLFPGWFAPWTLELAIRHSAIIVSPDYRLIPESTIDDALEDLEDSFKWIYNQLSDFLSQNTQGALQVDTSRIMIAGDSAGGYFSLQVAFNHPEAKAVTAAYPVVDTKSRYFTHPNAQPVAPAAVADDHMKQIMERKTPSIISADEELERLDLMFSILHNGRYPEFFPPDQRHLHILDRLDDGARFPRGGLFFFHGRDDTVVPFEGSLKLEEKLRSVDPSFNFHLEIRGGDHGFDGDTKLDDEWLANGLKRLVTAWLD